jgi:nucleoside-diphosphate-sugar epimerase
VRALVRSSSDVSFLKTLDNVELFEGDVSDPESLRRAVRGVDGVIHAAGLIKALHTDDFLRVNRGGTQSLLDACLAEKVSRLVFVSSLTAGGPSQNGQPVRPDDPQTPVTHYGVSKRAAEQVLLAQKDALHVTILRPAAIYGPRDREILVFFQALQRGVLPLTSAPSNRVSMISGADCATCCIAALAATAPSGSAANASHAN